MDNANSFSTISSASASSIVFFHKINLFTIHRATAHAVCMARTAAERNVGLSAKRVKETFLWFHLVDTLPPYYIVAKTKTIATLLFRLWLSFHSELCVGIVILVDSSGRILNLTQIPNSSKLPLR